MAAKHPKFTRQNVAQKKRVGEAWRKPRGIDNKQRVKLKWAGKMPNIGYGSPKKTRGMRRGKLLVVVHNAAELARCKPAECAVYIAATIGGKKRKVLLAQAAKAGVKILNPK
jgi:large subunit ribosomal protein L32e